ncbi:dual specificity protein phosphatase 19b [Puntigrus tetrazona]|uniref:dual specificity protein phosphatase 19b n=1 Tax=Puntigrus tetrazona TaxID=1606681 RepID=UPI001C89EC24|nr:dual specificity protein phosphatase 19b [Puntigrus tetrazona]
MHSLAQEIQGFSAARLRKQTTRVTTVTGEVLTETRRGGRFHAEREGAAACGFVRDSSLDLRVGVIRPFLLLSSQDAAHDIDTLKKLKVTHVLNVAYGVENAFPDLFTYKTVTVLDLPETDITSYFPECFEFINEASQQGGVVLVHCNAGVSRSASVVIGFLMSQEKMTFDEAFGAVKNTRPYIQPNPGFMSQLKTYMLPHKD